MAKSALARAISTLRMMSRKSGKSRAMVWSWARPSGCLLDEVLERVADAEVGGDDVAGLHPAEDPGDGAEVFHAALAGGAGVGALGRAGADAGVFEFGDGRGLLEVGEGVGVFGDVFAVEGVGGGGDLVEGGFPLGEDFAGEVGDVGLSLRPCFVLEDGVGAGRGRRARRRSSARGCARRG